MKSGKCFGLVLIIAAPSMAQQPDAVAVTTTAPPGVAVVHRRVVSPENLYHHIITVVPMTGKGTYQDPKRPMYLPASRASTVSRTDIVGFTFLPSDDGKSAIVEYVAADLKAFSQVYSDASLTVFEKGKSKKEDIEAAMQKYRKGFSLTNFGVTVR